MKPMTAQLMLTPAEPYGAPPGPVSRSGRVAARLNTWTSSIWRLSKPFLDRLVRPLSELGVPERAVGIGVSGIGEGREVAEDVEEIAAVPERIDQGLVVGARVLGGVAVLDEVDEALGVRVVGPGLPVDEGEEALPGGAQEVVAAVVGRLVERRHVGRPLEDRAQGLSGIGADVDDRLARVEALDEQDVDP